MASQPYTQYKLLAEAIPATSFAAGANSILGFATDPVADRNIDMNTQLQVPGQWPAERADTNWRHSDLKNVALPYVYPFFDQIVEIGNLK